MNMKSDVTQEQQIDEEPKTRRWVDTLLDTMRVIAREEAAKALHIECEHSKSVEETHNNG